MNRVYTSLANQIAILIDDKGKDSLQGICELLKNNVPYFDWVGFYFMHDDEQRLKVGPYSGERTVHSSIPYGTGICGQVAVSGKLLRVPDVSKEENYLACSIKTRSELVVPIFKDDVLVGQIDIDSHKTNPFTSDDEDFLKQICSWVAEVI